MRLGLIGAGSLGQTVLSALRAHLGAPLDFLSILLPADVLEPTRDHVGSLDAIARNAVFRSDLRSFLDDAPDLVAECAGHAAVRAYGPRILASGRDLALASVGALADDDLRAELAGAARAGGSRLTLIAGAVGALDLLGAAKLSGLRDVTYTGRKPPRAWRGTPAETVVELDRITAPVVFFEGSARRAAREFPLNANVAATVALGGLGFDDTRVKLIADPTIEGNLHEVAAQSACGRFSIAIEGVPSPINPKSSLTAGYSLAREILNRTREVVL
jgi:aspartate dehydrogenase